MNIRKMQKSQVKVDIYNKAKTNLESFDLALRLHLRYATNAINMMLL